MVTGTDVSGIESQLWWLHSNEEGTFERLNNQDQN